MLTTLEKLHSFHPRVLLNMVVYVKQEEMHGQNSHYILMGIYED